VQCTELDSLHADDHLVQGICDPDCDLSFAQSVIQGEKSGS